MKRRHRYTLNLLSIGFLAFALYLNFVRKESDETSAPANTEKSAQLQQASASLVSDHPEKKPGLK